MSEVLALQVSRLLVLGPSLLHLVLVDTKGAKRKGALEAVQIKDKMLNSLIQGWSVNRPPDEILFPFFVPRIRQGAGPLRVLVCFRVASPHTAQFPAWRCDFLLRVACFLR